MPRNVIFVAPFPSEVTMRFVRAAAQLEDVRLLGIVQTPPSGADERVYHDFVRVTEPLSLSDVLGGCEVLRKRHGKPNRIIGILEALQVQLAVARDRFEVPGTTPEVAELFRDKSKMKAALRAAGLPVARSCLTGRVGEARDFAAEVGYPIVLKPPAGMGAKSTFRLRDDEELVGALRGLSVVPERPVLLEEFLRGEEFSFETLSVGGQPHMHSISHYLPSCLHALENPWIKWCCLEPRDISGPEYDEARRVGFAAIRALGLNDGMTHMEWFRRPDGSVAIGEIAQRPPGANISLMTGLAHDRDMYRAWVRAVIDGVIDAPWDRKYAVGSAFLRGPGHGRVASVTGVRATHQKIGQRIVEANLPTLGTPKADTYEGDGYVVVRDPSTDVVRAALATIIETIDVGYSA